MQSNYSVDDIVNNAYNMSDTVLMLYNLIFSTTLFHRGGNCVSSLFKWLELVISRAGLSPLFLDICFPDF